VTEAVAPHQVAVRLAGFGLVAQPHPAVAYVHGSRLCAVQRRALVGDRRRHQLVAQRRRGGMYGGGDHAGGTRRGGAPR
jgi:hypothetical protein